MSHGLEGFQIGSYTIGAKIGQGASASVFRATHPSKPDAAIKIMPESETTQINAERFIRAAKLSAPLRHPNIVAVYDYGKIDGLGWYMVLEFVDGEDLSERLEKQPKIPVEQACLWTFQILDALQEAHTLDVLHRDIKPANILITRTPDGTEHTKLTDFGLAKMSNAAPGGVGALTQTGHIVGTPLYMAPEQLDATKVCRATDLYSVGLVLYEMLAGQRAVPGDTLEKILLNQLNPEFKVDIENPEIPSALRDTLRRACSKDLSERFSNTDHFSKSLRQALNHWKNTRTLEESSKREPRFTPTQAPPLVGLAETIQDLSQTPASSNVATSSLPRSGEFAAGVIRPGLSQTQHVQGPKNRLKTYIRNTSILVSILTVGILAIAALQNPVDFAPKYDPKRAQALLDDGWNRVTIPVSDGIELTAYHGAARATKAPTSAVVLFHDFDTSAELHGERLSPLRDQGVALVAFGQRGFSESQGTPSASSFYKDAQHVIEKVKKMYPKTKLYLYGMGVGAAVAASFAGQPEIAGIIAESPLHTLRNPLRKHIPGLEGDALFSISASSSAQGASTMLILYGEEDARATKKQARAVCKELGERVSSCALNAVPEAEHDNIAEIMGPSYYLKRIGRFLR